MKYSCLQIFFDISLFNSSAPSLRLGFPSLRSSSLNSRLDVEIDGHRLPGQLVSHIPGGGPGIPRGRMGYKWWLSPTHPVIGV